MDSDAVAAQSVMNERRTREIIKRGINEEYAIFDDGTVGKRSKYLEHEEGYYDVVIHGTPEWVIFFDTPIDSHTLAKIIKGRADYHGEPIRLLSCSTGKEKTTGKYDCFAQRLANELKAAVKAPNDLLWVFRPINGISKFTVGSEQNKTSGHMVIFQPHFK